jgi:hypothetical protein
MSNPVEEAVNQLMKAVESHPEDERHPLTSDLRERMKLRHPSISAVVERVARDRPDVPLYVTNHGVDTDPAHRPYLRGVYLEVLAARCGPTAADKPRHYAKADCDRLVQTHLDRIRRSYAAGCKEEGTSDVVVCVMANDANTWGYYGRHGMGLDNLNVLERWGDDAPTGLSLVAMTLRRGLVPVLSQGFIYADHDRLSRPAPAGHFFAVVGIRTCDDYLEPTNYVGDIYTLPAQGYDHD